VLVETAPDFTVTEPVLAIPAPLATGVSPGLAAATDGEATYISAQPGSYPDGEAALIINLRTGAVRPALLLDGGFDPVAVPAAVGDTLEIVVNTPERELLRIRVIVPAAMPPIIVRTDPPKRKRDVPIGIALSIIFSEPLDPLTTGENIELFSGGEPVPGTVSLLEPGFVAHFRPHEPLEPETEYHLVVRDGVRDLSGDALETGDDVPFTTGTLEPLPPQPTQKFMAMSAGSFHTCALTAEGAVYCWGNNHNGHLGYRSLDRRSDECRFFVNGDATCSTRPRWVPETAQFTALDGGEFGRCGMRGDATFCWDNRRGTRWKPPVAEQVAGGLVFSSVSSGGFNCGITAQGTAYCWGRNDWGQLGDGTTIDRQAPVPVAGGLTFAQLSAGARHACGVTVNGRAYCWGRNNQGQLGSGEVPGRDSPTPVAVAGGLTFRSVSSGVARTCGLTENGQIFCWGNRPLGSYAPEYSGYGDPDLTTVHVSAGAMCALRSDGAVFCWGTFGPSTRHSYTGPIPGPRRHFTELSLGRMHACGLTLGGDVYCWGENSSGELGNGTTESAHHPVHVIVPSQ
jgi:alpha-tubulin suppressor-like RCC1 family protein